MRNQIAFDGWKKKTVLRLFKLHQGTLERINKLNKHGKITKHESCDCKFCDFTARNKNDVPKLGFRP